MTWPSEAALSQSILPCLFDSDLDPNTNPSLRVKPTFDLKWGPISRLIHDATQEYRDECDVASCKHWGRLFRTEVLDSYKTKLCQYLHDDLVHPSNSHCDT